MKAKNTIVASILNNTLSLTFSDGNDLHLDYTTLAPEIVKQAVLHGLKQKLVDAAAISAKDGKYATVAQKYAAVKEVFDRLTGANGRPATWNKGRAESDGPSNARGLLVRALAELKNKPTDKIDEWLETLSKEQVTALRNNSQVAAKIAELKSRGSSMDSDELLSQLDMPEGDDADNGTDDDSNDDIDAPTDEAAPAPAPVADDEPVAKPKGRGRSKKTVDVE